MRLIERDVAKISPTFVCTGALDGHNSDTCACIVLFLTHAHMYTNNVYFFYYTVTSKSSWTICKHDKISIYSEFKSSYEIQPVLIKIWCWVTNNMDRRSGPTFGRSDIDPYCLKRSLLNIIFFEIVGKYFYFVRELLEGTVYLIYASILLNAKKSQTNTFLIRQRNSQISSNSRRWTWQKKLSGAKTGHEKQETFFKRWSQYPFGC